MKGFVVRFSIWITILGVVLTGCATSGSPSGSSPTSATVATQAPLTGATSTAPASENAAAVPATGGGTIVYNLMPAQSSADYKVREQLANISFPTDAVGKTGSVSGSLAIQPDGKILSEQSKFVVDVTSLQSDKSMRDNFVRRNILQTEQYPQVTFVPTSVSGLPNPLPQSGSVNFQLTGNLTIQDVTKPVTWQVNANVQGNQITGQATTSFKFEDFNLSQPQVPVVLSVEDHITLEMNFTLQKAGS